MQPVLVMFQQKQIQLIPIVNGYFCKIRMRIFNLTFMSYSLILELHLVAFKLQMIARLACLLLFLIQFQKISRLIQL